METTKIKNEIVDLDIKNKYLNQKIEQIDIHLKEYEGNKTNFNVLQNIVILLLPFFAAIIDILLGGTAIGKLLQNVPIDGSKFLKICIVTITIVTVELALGLLLDHLSHHKEEYTPPYKLFKIISYAFILGIPFLASTEIIHLSKNIDNPIYAAVSLLDKVIQYFAFVAFSIASHFYLLFNAKRITSSFSNMWKNLLFIFYSRRKQRNIERTTELSTQMFSLITSLILIDSNFNIDSFPITETTKNTYTQFYNN